MYSHRLLNVCVIFELYFFSTFFMLCVKPLCRMGVRRNFSREGGQSRHFAYLFQVVGDATQMDVYKKENVQRYGNSCMQCFFVRKLYTE